MTKIYTKTGDKGKTSLLKGKRILKSDLRIEALGSVDELNSMIGLAVSSRHQVFKIKRELLEIQSDLFRVNSWLADPHAKASNLRAEWLLARVKAFEEHMDEMNAKMPVLRHFILPGGVKAGAALHLARAVCRRTERRIVELSNKGKIDKNILIYFNRLSDLLFTMARFTNFKQKKKELRWYKI